MPEYLSETGRDALVAVYEQAKRIGLLGPGPVVDHIDHGFAFIPPLISAQCSHVIDIGSGGGVPGLLLALALPEAEVTLLDGMAKRCAFLRDAIATLEISDRVSVLEGRAENHARAPEFRRTFDAVTARSFASPAVTAECGVGFLRHSGVLVVSEPPDRADRWPSDGMDQLGMSRVESDPTVAVFALDELSDRWPRRVGVPGKRPLF